MDVSTLLKRLQLLFPPPLRGASNCQDIDIGSCHSDFGSKERGNDFILILHYCKQEVLKHLDATLLDFILLFSEFDDERFSPINVLYALGSLAFKEGNIEYLGNVQTVVIENYDSPDAIFLMNDLGVMLSLQGMYKRSEECFSKAKKWFQQEEDHLKNAVVTLNLAALYMILGEYKKACEFCNDAADLCHGFTMRSTKDIDLPMKVLRRTADLLSECGNFEKFCHILRIGGKYNFGARKASKIDVRKWLMEIQLKEQTGEKVEEQELKDCSSYLLTFLEKPDAQSLNADLMRTVFTAARVNHRNGLYEEAFKLLEKLESTLLLTGGRKDLLYGLMLFLVGQFKYMYGCGMTVDAENDLKQADAILEKHFGRNHLFAYCKKLLGSCALLNNNLGNASTNLAEASAFFEDLNSKHYEVADISFKLAQLQIEGNFEDAKEIQNAVQKAVEMLACSFGRISPKTGSACVQAGLILQKVDKGAAINEVNKAVEIYHSLGLQLDHPVINLCQGMTGLFQLCSGNKEEAEKYFVDALKESPETDESCHGLHHDNMCEVDNLVTEFSNGYFREKPLYRSAKMFSLVGLVAMKKGKDIRRKYLDVLVSLAEESDTEEHGIIDFAGHCCFVSHISCLAGPNVYFFVFPDPEVNSQSSNDDEVIISRSKNSSCILFWRTSCKIQEMKELRNLDFHICESVRALFLQPKFGKSYNKTNDFYLELPLQTLSLCAQIDCLPLLVEVKLGEPCKEHANFDNLTSSALEDSSPEPAVHVSYLSYEFSNKRTAELAFDYLAFSASKEPLLNDVKAVEVADGHSPYMNFAFFSSQHSRYSHFSVFVDKELPVLRVKCRHLSESKSNGFCCSVKSALENVMYFLCEDVRISFKPFVQLSCGVCSMVGFRGSLDVTCNCIVATKTESSVSSPQAEEAMFNNFARDCFTEKELDCSTKQVLNSVTCRHSTLFHHQGSSSEASTSNCSNESDQNPFSSSRTSLCGAKAQVLKSDFDKECHVSKLQNQEVCSGSHADVYLRLLEYLLSDRNVTPEHEALNSVVPDSGVEERSLLSADFLSASSWNSVPVSPESFCSRDSLPSASSSPSGCISLHEKFEGEPCEWSDVDLANSCLAKVQNKSETKETHRYAEICLLKSQLSEEETPDNCDSIDGVLKQLESNVTCEEPFGESKEYPDVQIGANCHPQCKNSLEEIELSAAEGTGVRGSRNSGIDRFVLSKDEESATFQNNCFELQQQINKLEEKLRQTEAEKQQLKADLGRYLFLEDREKRTGKLLSAPRAFTGDEIRCCGGSTSSKCLSATGKLLGRTASLQDKPESSGTSSASLPSRDDQGGERCTTLKSCTSTMGFAHRSEDNGQKFTPDHVYDLSASASFNIDSENPVSINIEDNDPLSMESVGTNDKEGICVPVSSEQSGPSSGASSVCVNALRTAEGSPVCSRSSSQGSSKKSAKAPEVVLTSHSASAPHRVRPYFGACHAAAVGNKSYVRSDGSAFSDVSIGGFERVGLLGGSSNNESLYGSSAHAAAAPLRNQTGLSNVTLGWNGSSSNGVNNVDGFLNIDHGVTGQRDYSRESYFPYVQQSNTVSEITRSGFAYGLTSSDFTLRGSGVAGIRPLPSVYTTQRHVMSDGDSAFKDEQAVNERSHNADLALGHQSLANINRYHVLGTSASAGSAVIVDNCGLPPPFSVSSSSVSSTTVVSTTTSRSLVVSASNHTRSLVNSTSRNSVVSSTTPGDGNSETSLAPSSRNADEDHSRGALLNRDNGMNDIEPIDDSLLALEGRVADASALVERVLGEREEWEQFEREMERKERMNRERRERERREREEREMQEAEQWPQQQEAVSARSPWLCEHYQRHCRVRFPCCTQFYPCHRCHNTSRNCENEEAKACHVTHLKCSFCEHEQEIDENSGVCGKCGAKVAAYLCSICKHFTNVDKNPYHCEKCGICRIHAGKSCQCEVCNVCLDKRLEGNHECRPDSSHNECYNCLEVIAAAVSEPEGN